MPWPRHRVCLIELGPDGAHPGELAWTLDNPGATLSFHPGTLLQAGLIEAEPSGRFIRCRADFDRMQGLADFPTRSCCGGNPSRCVPTASSAR